MHSPSLALWTFVLTILCIQSTFTNARHVPPRWTQDRNLTVVYLEKADPGQANTPSSYNLTVVPFARAQPAKLKNWYGGLSKKGKWLVQGGSVVAVGGVGLYALQEERRRRSLQKPDVSVEEAEEYSYPEKWKDQEEDHPSHEDESNDPSVTTQLPAASPETRPIGGSDIDADVSIIDLGDSDAPASNDQEEFECGPPAYVMAMIQRSLREQEEALAQIEKERLEREDAEETQKTQEEAEATAERTRLEQEEEARKAVELKQREQEAERAQQQKLAEEAEQQSKDEEMGQRKNDEAIEQQRADEEAEQQKKDEEAELQSLRKNAEAEAEAELPAKIAPQEEAEHVNATEEESENIPLPVTGNPESSAAASNDVLTRPTGAPTVPPRRASRQISNEKVPTEKENSPEPAGFEKMKSGMKAVGEGASEVVTSIASNLSPDNETPSPVISEGLSEASSSREGSGASNASKKKNKNKKRRNRNRTGTNTPK